LPRRAVAPGIRDLETVHPRPLEPFSEKNRGFSSFPEVIGREGSSGARVFQPSRPGLSQYNSMRAASLVIASANFRHQFQPASSRTKMLSVVPSVRVTCRFATPPIAVVNSLFFFFRVR